MKARRDHIPGSAIAPSRATQVESHGFSPSLSHRLDHEVSLQGAGWRVAGADTNDFPARVQRELGVQIVSGVLSREHVQMFVEIPPHIAVSDLVRRVGRTAFFLNSSMKRLCLLPLVATSSIFHKGWLCIFAWQVHRVGSAFSHRIGAPLRFVRGGRASRSASVRAVGGR
jgi:Transposase IS200 like